MVMTRAQQALIAQGNDQLEDARGCHSHKEADLILTGVEENGHISDVPEAERV